MSIFDSPVVPKRAPAASRAWGDDAPNAVATFGDDQVPKDDNNDDNDEPMDPLDYEDLMNQAAKWKASLSTTLDQVYKLRVESAILLDKFAMLYPVEETMDDYHGNFAAADMTAGEEGVDKDEEENPDGNQDED